MPMSKAEFSIRENLVRAGRAVLFGAATFSVHAFTVSDLELAPGFSIAVFTSEVPNARQMALSPSGILFVGTRSRGVVYAVVDRNGDFVADEVHIIAKDLYMPSGIAFRDGSLYVAEVHRILRFDNIEDQLEHPPSPVVVYDALPTQSHHGWKFIAFGPDGRLYVPVGSPCNICAVTPPFGTILRMLPDGTEVEVYASGIRNSVGFDWHPVSLELWFSDNGADMMGDDLPPCELNRAPHAGLHFGFPYFHAGDIADPDFGSGREARDFTPPAKALGAHVTPLGINFYDGHQFPSAYRHALFVAEHGSWNRSRKVGYRVMVARISKAGRVIDYEPFITGWLKGQAHWGRPVDFEVMADGSMLISDDHAGAVYRVSFGGH